MARAVAEQRRDYVGNLLEALDNPEPLTRVRAAWILGELMDARAVEGLAESASRHQDDPEFLAAVAEALGKIGDDRALPVLVEMAGASFLKARVAAVRALAGWKELASAEEALRRALDDPNAIVRRQAGSILGVLTPEKGRRR